MKVCFATPTMVKPFPKYLESLEKTAHALNAKGIENVSVFEIGCPYISKARAELLRRALDAKCDVVVFIDHDLEWEPEDMLKLLETKGDVVAGTYRFKLDEEGYMATLYTGEGYRPILREDGCMLAEWVPAGFLKVTEGAVRRFAKRYPELLYGNPMHPSLDLFNHGVHEGVWYGEDYAFSRRWNEIDKLWLVPDLNLTHHSTEKAYPGNFHQFMLRQPKPDL